MDNLWQRRSNTSKLSLSTSSPNNLKENPKTDSPRTFSSAKRFGGDTSSHGKSNPFNTISPSTTTNSGNSPAAGASSAFGLGSGAFASFGSSTKPPKSPGTALDFSSSSVDKREKDSGKDNNGERVKTRASSSSLASKSSTVVPEHPLKSTWVVWYRPPTSKYSDYEKSTIALASFATVESFWTVYTHLKRPSTLPSVSDYHLFKKGIRPVWEDEENKKGGKWIVRLKKGVADRYWEDLLLAIVGDQFAEAGEEVCGAVLSVRSGEDVLSVWTKIDGGRNVKIRETIKRLLAFPQDTIIVWKSHDDSIAQRSAIDQARQEKGSELCSTPPSPDKYSPPLWKDKCSINANQSLSPSPSEFTRTEDENCHLFPCAPGHYKLDPNAVPTPTPGTYLEEDTMPAGHFGPRPTNTLNSPTYAKAPQGLGKATKNVSSSLKETRTRGFTALSLEASRGNNVSDHDIMSLQHDLDSGRSVKRLKTDQGEKQRDISELVNSLEDVDELAADSTNLKRLDQPQYLNNQPSALGQTPRLPKPSRSHSDSSPEYQKVEDMMNSESYADRAEAGSKHGDFVVQIPKEPYKGTARHNAVPRSRGRPFGTGPTQQKTIEASRYFENRNDNVVRNGQGSLEGTYTKHSLSLSQTPGRDLRHQFIPTNGGRRGQEDMSSDELASDTHELDHADVARVRPEDAELQSSIRAQMKPSTGLPRSNITHGNFTPSKRTRPDPNRSSKLSKGNSPSKPATFHLRSIRRGQVYIQNDNMALVDDTNDNFDLFKEGTKIDAIQKLKLSKLQWADSSPKIRLEMSLDDRIDNKYDVEFRTVVDGVNFNKFCVCNKVNRTRDFMDRMFEKDKPPEIVKDRCAVNEREITDLDLMGKRKVQRDEATETASSKRRRSNPKVTDKLREKNGQAVSSKISDVEVFPKRTKRPDSIDGVLQGLNLRNTRSNRQSTIAEPSEKQRSPSFDIFPEEERYSIVYGLGPPWKKPLVYPKEGKKRATVDHGDLERLDEGQFLNDNLVGFYLRYLEYQLESEKPEVAKKIYWFNTYFFASLTQTGRGKKGINYDAVRKWTRNVDILTYDYAIVPINESAHWYVVIICNLPALDRIAATSALDSATPTKEDTKRQDGLDEVQIKHIISPYDEAQVRNPEEIDEQNTTNSFAELSIEEENGTCPRVQSADKLTDQTDQLTALRNTPPEDSKVRNEETKDDPIPVGSPQRKSDSQRKTKRKSNLHGRTMDPDQPAIIILDSLGLKHSPTTRALKDYLHSEVEDKRGGMIWDDSQMKGMNAQQIPLQDNFCDCGLFVLEYMNKFVEDPKDFAKKLMLKQHDEKKDWPKLVSSEMRAKLRGLIQDLHEEQQMGGKGGKINPQAKVNFSETKKNERTLDPGNHPPGVRFPHTPSKRALEDEGRVLPTISPIDCPKTVGTAANLDECTQETPDVVLSLGESNLAVRGRVSPTSGTDGLSTRNLALASALPIDAPSGHASELIRNHGKTDYTDTGANREMPSTSKDILVVIPDSQPSQPSQPSQLSQPNQAEKRNKFLEPEKIEDPHYTISLENKKSAAYVSQAQAAYPQKQDLQQSSLLSVTPDGPRGIKDTLYTKGQMIIDISE